MILQKISLKIVIFLKKELAELNPKNVSIQFSGSGPDIIGPRVYGPIHTIEVAK